MLIEDTGIIVEIKKFSDNDAIIWIFSENHGLISGIVKFFHSKKNRNSCIIGNMVEFTWQARLAEHLGKITLELKKSFQSLFIDNKFKLTALCSISSIIYQVLPERMEEKFLYYEYLKLLNNIHVNDNWIISYIRFELNLLAELGFGLDLSSCVATNSTDDLFYISPKSGKAVSKEAGKKYDHLLFKIPNFLLSENNNYSEEDIINALQITSYFIEKFILQTKNLPINFQRVRLNELFNKKLSQ